MIQKTLTDTVIHRNVNIMVLWFVALIVRNVQIDGIIS